MVTANRRRAFQFFCEHAGGIVGARARCALDLARAEELLETAEEAGAADWRVELDPEPWDEGTEISAEEARERFESGAWTGPYGVTVRIGGEPVASLWGIVVGPRATADPYIRVVRAELASEAYEPLRDAVAAADVRSLADELADRVGTVRATLELRELLDRIEQEAGR